VDIQDHPQRAQRGRSHQPEDLAQLEETLSVLSDPEALADIREADAAYARGDVLRGVEAVRRLGG
jgi:hypothetical protein